MLVIGGKRLGKTCGQRPVTGSRLFDAQLTVLLGTQHEFLALGFYLEMYQCVDIPWYKKGTVQHI